MPLNFS